MADGMVFEEGSDNVFADLGFPDAAERLIKAELAMRSARSEQPTQASTAAQFGMDEPEVTEVWRNSLPGLRTNNQHRLRSHGLDD